MNQNGCRKSLGNYLHDCITIALFGKKVHQGRSNIKITLSMVAPTGIFDSLAFVCRHHPQQQIAFFL